MIADLQTGLIALALKGMRPPPAAFSGDPSLARLAMS